VTSSDDAESSTLDIQVRILSVLVLLEAVAMVLFVVLDVVSALRAADAEWGAVWFVLVVMGIWAGGLVLVSRGVIRGRRWAFTPVLFTQLLFGAAAVSFFGAAEAASRVAWGLVVVVAVVVLRLLFSRPVREHLVYANSS
jgi:nucleoside recognition membrane protein YjiH